MLSQLVLDLNVYLSEKYVQLKQIYTQNNVLNQIQFLSSREIILSPILRSCLITWAKTKSGSVC